MTYEVLYPIISKLESDNIAYALGGSGLLFFLGLIDSVNDWDITVDCKKDTLIHAISGYDWIDQRTGDYPFASQFRLSIHTHKIDFIGGFACYSNDTIIKLPVSYFLEIQGIKLSNPEIWYVAYDLMGRKEKSNLIMKYLTTNKDKTNKYLIKQLLMQDGLNKEIRQELLSLMDPPPYQSKKIYL